MTELWTMSSLAATVAFGFAWEPGAPAWSPTTIFSPASTPAHAIFGLSLFVLGIAAAIFLGIGALLVYVLVRYRARPGDYSEPPQVFGSTQIELAWTIVPILIIVVLFLGTARVIFAIQDAKKPDSALEVVAIGHQFWWEFHYPKYNVATANELHVPVSDSRKARPTFVKLTSADVVHSFWIPRLAGKTDMLPNRVNELWIDPQQTGLYQGQCAQFCGAEHAKMLLRVYVDTPAQFQTWIEAQQRSAGGSEAAREKSDSTVLDTDAAASASMPGTIRLASKTAGKDGSSQTPAEAGRNVFEHQACINCHTVRGTVADGRFGPDLTHLMSRETIAAGAAKNTPENLKRWIEDPNRLKPGALMPAMHLTDAQNAEITSYLSTLK